VLINDQGVRVREPRNTILASKVSAGDKRKVVAAAVLEGISVSTFTRNAVLRACRERIAESGKEPFLADGVS
jgi:hypothetical protein